MLDASTMGPPAVNQAWGDITWNVPTIDKKTVKSRQFQLDTKPVQPVQVQRLQSRPQLTR